MRKANKTPKTTRRYGTMSVPTRTGEMSLKLQQAFAEEVEAELVAGGDGTVPTPVPFPPAEAPPIPEERRCLNCEGTGECTGTSGGAWTCTECGGTGVRNSATIPQAGINPEVATPTPVIRISPADRAKPLHYVHHAATAPIVGRPGVYPCCTLSGRQVTSWLGRTGV